MYRCLKAVLTPLMFSLFMGPGPWLALSITGYGQTSQPAPGIIQHAPIPIAEWNFENAAKRAAVNPLNFMYTADAGIVQNVNNAPLYLHGPALWAGIFVTGYGGTGLAPNGENWFNGAGTYNWEIAFSSEGYESLTVSSAQRTSDVQGPRDFMLQYSTDRISWTDLTPITVGNATPNWTGLVTDFPLPALLNDRTLIYLRWLQYTNISVPGTTITGTGGTNRIDNIIIKGEEILNPVPGTASANQPICSGNTPADLILSGYNGDIIQWQSSSTGTGNWSNINLATSDILSGAQMGVLIQTTYYRAAVTLGINTAHSNIVTINVNPLLPVSVTIAASATEVCAGTPVVFTANPVNGGNASYRWFVNGSHIGPNAAAFTHTPAHGDVIYVELTSNVTCPTGNPANSNTITLIVNDILPASVSVTASENDICSGTQVTFTALPENGGSSPSFQWYVNGSPTGNNNPSYNYTPANGDQVHVVMTSSLTCKSGSPATSNSVIMQVTLTQAPEFTAFGPYCQYEILPPLPTTSVNGITGHWQPSTINATTPVTDALYMFFPDDGQCSNFISIRITVNEMRTPQFDEVGPLCQGSAPYELPTASLNGITGNWSPAFVNTLNAGMSQPNFFPDPGQCANTSFLTIVVEANDPTVFDPIGPLCQGSTPPLLPSSDLNGVPGTWSPSMIFTSNPVTINYTFTPNPSSCANPFVLPVTIEPIPDISCPDNITVCISAPAILLSGGDPVGEIFSLRGEVITSFNPAVEGQGDHMLTYTYTEDGCSSSCDFIITVNALPVVDAGNDMDVSFGTVVAILDATASGSGYLSYSWSPAEYFTDPDVLKPVTLPLTESQLFTLTVTDGNGCENSDQFTVAVSGGPLAVFPEASDTEICLGEQVQLFARPSGGVQGNYTYSWTSDPPLTPSTVSDPVFTPPLGSTTFTVVVNDGNSTVEESVSVMVHPLPNLNVIPDVDFCANDNILLLASLIPVAGGTISIDGIESVNFQPVAEGGVGIYHIDFSKANSHGCENSIDFTITIKPVPQADAGGDLDVPYGQPVTLSGADATSGGGGNLTYAWSPAGIFENATILNPTTLPITSSHNPVTLTVTENGCLVKDEMQIDVLGGPLDASPTADPPAFCVGETTQLFANASGGFGELTYQWSTLAGGPISTEENPFVSPGSTTTYHLVVTDENEASFTASIVVTVHPLPAVACLPAFTMSVNAGAFPLGGGSPAGGTYYVDGNPVTVFDPGAAGSGTYNVEYRYTNSNGCSSQCGYTINVTEVELYALTLEDDPDGSGNLTGAGNFAPGEQVTITATGRPIGWTFSHWSGPNGSQFGDPNQATTTFIMPGQAVTLFAHFIQILWDITIEIEGEGVVNVAGQGPFTAPGGVFLVGNLDDQSMSFAPAPWFELVDVVVNGVSLGPVASHTLIDVAQDVMVKVIFRDTRELLRYLAGAGGRIEGEASQLVPPGASGTMVEAVPDEGYHFVEWSDGNTDSQRTDTFDDAPLEVSAIFAINTYTLAYTVVDGGSISGITPQTIEHGNDGSEVEAVPDEGYYFVDWSDGLTDAVRTDTGIVTDTTFTARFERLQFSLSYTAGVGGTIVGPGMQQVYYGDDGQAVEAVPDEGYNFSRWSDGHPDNPRTDLDVHSDITAVAEFRTGMLEVRFKVDMRYAANFRPGIDKVYLTGSMYNFAMPGTYPEIQELHPTDDPQVLSLAVRLPRGRFIYKYYLNEGWAGEEWNGAPVRNVELINRSIDVYDYFGNTTDPTAVYYPEGQGVTFYPNPAVYVLNIATGGQEPIRMVRIVNMMGQPVYLSRVEDVSSLQVQVDQLQPGLYFVQVLTFTGWHTGKIQVIR